MSTRDDFDAMWNDADSSDHETRMARRRMVARLVGQTVGHRHEIDDVVGWLLDETVEIDRSVLDEITIRANMNQRHPMENANPSKTEIKNHIAEISDIAKRQRK
jgi:hypothetical protein